VRQAACRDAVDLGLDFFVDSSKQRHQPAVAACKAVCVVCPVRDTCLSLAMTNKEMFGIWGGVTFEERRKLRRRSCQEAA
jgi:WhiB family redox-sensing transcriptional regulator